MNFSALTKILSLAAVGCGLTFANNIVQYQVVSNSSSVYTNPVGFPNYKIGVSNAIQFSNSTSNTLVGTGIAIGSLSRLLPNPALTATCNQCSLTFQTGTLQSYQNVGGQTWLNGYPKNPSYSFNQGGTAAIYGGVDWNGNGILDADDIPTGSVLMTGSFIGPVSVSGMGPTTDYQAAAGIVLNSQNQQLNKYLFGNPFAGPVWTGQMNLVFNPFGPQSPGNSNSLPLFNSKTIISGSFVNTALPEPGSVLLFSSLTAILGIGVLRRRRAQQNNA